VALAGILVLDGCAPAAPMRDTPSLGVVDTALANGAPEFALRIAQNMIAKNPASEAAWVRQGDAYAAMDNPFEAKGSYHRALSLQRHSTGAAMGMGRLALRSNPTEAAEWFGKVLETHRDDPAALNDLGIAEDLLGQHAAAQVNYRKALNVQPDLSAAQVNLGLSLAVSGHAQEGVAMIQPLAQGSAATPRSREDLATALLLSGQESAARTVLRRDIPENRLDDSIRALRALGTMQAVPGS
jgi:Flp pilus assembly protein TadD